MAAPVNEGIADVQRRGSRIIAEGYDKLPHASLMMAAGVISSLADRKKPFVTVVNSYTTHIPGHAHLDVLGKVVVEALKDLGFNVFYCNIGGAVDDGIAMGHFGMKYSLASRELIADQIETVIGAHPVDGWVGIGNCDKIVPAMYMAMARLNVPAVYVSGGPMLAGEGNSDLVSVFQGVGAHSAGRMSLGQLETLASGACQTCGSCAGMFTANSMNCLGEAIGFALPGNGTITATYKVGEGRRGNPVFEINPERVQLVQQAAFYLKQCVERGVRPLDVLTQESLDNAFRLDMAMGGSTNTVLHTLALAYEAGIPYSLARINELAGMTPELCRVSPSRPDVHVQDVHAAGGISAIIRELTRAGKFNGDALSVTGQTLAQIVSGALLPDGNIIRSADNPYSATGGLAILYGNIAPKGSVVKIAGVADDMRVFEGRARVYESQESALRAILGGEVRDGDVVSILYEGPKGGPGMQEMLSPTSAISGAGIRAALITDGRFSGGTVGSCVGHISPEAAERGPIAALRDGDTIIIDTYARTINVRLSDGEIQDRLSALPSFTPRVTRGWLGRYAYLATSADTGAVLRNPYL